MYKDENGKHNAYAQKAFYVHTLKEEQLFFDEVTSDLAAYCFLKKASTSIEPFHVASLVRLNRRYLP
jgi:hypothetical protein